jgi:purine-nucleoside phosphorylase
MNDERLGVRFPDMSQPYSPQLLRLAREIAQKENIRLYSGVYAGVPGPCFETKAEYRYLSIIGADAVGMSTVPETIVAIHSGLRVFALSVITDLALRDENNTITHEEVLRTASASAPAMIRLFTEMIARIQKTGTE